MNKVKFAEDNLQFEINRPYTSISGLSSKNFG